jgi:hypothetical protein
MLAVSDLKEIAVLVFQTISGDYREPRFIDFSPGGRIPHRVIQIKLPKSVPAVPSEATFNADSLNANCDRKSLTED